MVEPRSIATDVVHLAAARRVSPALVAWVVPLEPTGGRLAVGRPGDAYYRDAWDYLTVDAAIAAMVGWELEEAAEPAGWVHHPFSGRTREG